MLLQNAPTALNRVVFAVIRWKVHQLDFQIADVGKLDQTPGDRANEQVTYQVNQERNAYNTAGSALAMTWNILCAFQMAYLYYLWFVGPIIAALWVYPMKELRDAMTAVEQFSPMKR